MKSVQNRDQFTRSVQPGSSFLLLMSLITFFLTGIALTALVISLSPNQFFPKSIPILYVIITVLIAFISSVILGDRDSTEIFVFPDRFGYIVIALCSAVVLLTIFKQEPLFFSTGPKLISTSQFSVFILISHIVTAVYALYLLENIYRYALCYQRRIGRLIFLGFVAIILAQLVLSSRWLLYGWVPVSWMSNFGIINSIAIGVILLGFIKYRIDSERVKVTRGAVYSSFSLLFAGAFFTAVGGSIFLLRNLGITIDSFDLRVLGISAVVTLVIVGGSARMRRRVRKFINRRVYDSKYDYRSQFFELHRMSFQTDENSQVFEEVLEHLRSTLDAEHAYLFLCDEQGEDYTLLTPKERNLPDAIRINNRSTLVKTLYEKGEYFGLLNMTESSAMSFSSDNRRKILDLHISNVAPVFHNGKLLAILAIRRDTPVSFNTEEIALIEVYCTTIGDLIFKKKILRERLEQKQFESFSHMASFIAHDVKNQVSTLKLLLRNAEINISNPEFYKSLLVSLRHCSDNLDLLVQKLQQPPSKDRLRVTSSLLAPVIRRVIDESGLERMEHLTLLTQISDDISAAVDDNAFYYTIKNLVVNALESMGNDRGFLTIKLGRTEDAHAWLQEKFPSREELFRKHSVFISVEDSGCGMNQQFLDSRLFHPFATTKDKGVGIGLYQCKTLIEQMNGKIICRSAVAKGTVFCIIL